MKKIIVKDIKIKVVCYDEGDYRLSSTSRAFNECNIECFNEIDSFNYIANGIAGDLEYGCTKNDFEFEFEDKVLKKLNDAEINVEILKNKIFNIETNNVEVKDEYGNILFIYKVDKDLNPPVSRKATHEKLRDFILATEGYDIDAVNNNSNSKYEYDMKAKDALDKLNNVKIFLKDSEEYENYIVLVKALSFIKDNNLYKKVKNFIDSFTKVWAYDGTIFYVKKGIKSVIIPKKALNNVGKFIGKGGKNIKEIQKECNCRITLI